MVRPEPDQPLDESNFRPRRRVQARLRLLQKQLLRKRRGGGRIGLGRRRRDGRSRVGGHKLRHSRTRHPLAPIVRLALGVELEHRPRNLGGIHVRAGREADMGPVQLREQRAARVGGNRRDRARTRPEAESVQGEGGLGLRIVRHGDSPVARSQQPMIRRAPTNRASGGSPRCPGTRWCRGRVRGRGRGRAGPL